MRSNHISVCVCTFKRPALLLRSLHGIGAQDTQGCFTYSIVVTDNDGERSAEETVRSFAATVQVPVEYCVESRQNIALARNKAIASADGDFIAFIDDDEIPPVDWLLSLYRTCMESHADGILGPVLPHFDDPPPAWVTKGKFFVRPSHPTGYVLSWSQCRTGNVLIRRRILSATEEPFLPQFGTGGEDVDFFRRMIAMGYVFRWCHEAPVHEVVPPSRSSARFLLRRALLRGSNFPKQGAGRAKNLLKSLAAVPAYTLALPVLAALGQHLFLKYLIKLLEHVARIVSLSGIQLVSERET